MSGANTFKNIIAAILFMSWSKNALCQQKDQKDNGKEKTRKSEYKHAIGIRAGETSGISYKYIGNEGHGFEGLLGLWPNAVGITGLYERHTSTSVSGLKWYYGAGAHVSTKLTKVYHYDSSRDQNYYRFKANGAQIGIDGILGIDYKISVIPFAISLDVKPLLEINYYGNIYAALDPGLGIRFAF